MEFQTQVTDEWAETFGVYTALRQFTTLNQHNAQCFALHVGVNLTLSIPTYFNPKGVIIFLADDTAWVKTRRNREWEYKHLKKNIVRFVGRVFWIGYLQCKERTTTTFIVRHYLEDTMIP
jgi:hypothetical protein